MVSWAELKKDKSKVGKVKTSRKSRSKKKRKREDEEGGVTEEKGEREEDEKEEEEKVQSTISSSKPVIAIDCEMVGVGSSGSRSVLARCCLVDYDERVVYDKYVKCKERFFFLKAI